MASLWLLTGIVTAVFISAVTLMQKHLTERYTSLELSFVSSLLAAVFLLPFGAVSWGDGVAFTPVLGAAVLAVGVANTVGVYAFLRALEIGDISVASPLRQTLPVFVAVMEPLILMMPYRLPVLLGAGLASVGAYVTLIEPSKPFKPLKRLQGKGPLLALASAFFLAVGAIAAKFAVDRMAIGVFVVLVFALQTAGYWAVIRLQGRQVRTVTVWTRPLLLLGVLTAVRQVLIFATIRLSTAAEATILFRIAILMDILVGYWLFKEQHIRYRLVGGAFIFAGVLAVV